jgi:hypothetical protein
LYTEKSLFHHPIFVLSATGSGCCPEVFAAEKKARIAGAADASMTGADNQ